MSEFSGSRLLLDGALIRERRLKPGLIMAFSALNVYNAVAKLDYLGLLVRRLAATVIGESQLSVDGQLFCTSYLKLCYSFTTFSLVDTIIECVQFTC